MSRESQLMNCVPNVPVQVQINRNDVSTDYAGTYEEANEPLTIDDVRNARNGGSLQRYHAFLLFDDEDIDVATEILNKLETVYKLKVNCLFDVI